MEEREHRNCKLAVTRIAEGTQQRGKIGCVFCSLGCVLAVWCLRALLVICVRLLSLFSLFVVACCVWSVALAHCVGAAAGAVEVGRNLKHVCCWWLALWWDDAWAACLRREAAIGDGCVGLWRRRCNWSRTWVCELRCCAVVCVCVCVPFDLCSVCAAVVGVFGVVVGFLMLCVAARLGIVGCGFVVCFVLQEPRTSKQKKRQG